MTAQYLRIDGTLMPEDWNAAKWSDRQVIDYTQDRLPYFNPQRQCELSFGDSMTLDDWAVLIAFDDGAYHTVVVPDPDAFLTGTDTITVSALVFNRGGALSDLRVNQPRLLLSNIIIA